MKTPLRAPALAGLLLFAASAASAQIDARMPRGEESFPRFSPDGSQLAFTGTTTVTRTFTSSHQRAAARRG